MRHNFVYPTVTEALPSLLTRIEDEAPVVESRAGLTKELTHIGISLMEPLDREILCDFRKPNLAAQIAETMWVLAGRDDIGWLENYLPRVRDFSDDGLTWRAGYGARLRRWEDHAHARKVDQWRWLVAELRKDPETRRAVMSIWDPTIDTDPGKDIPCNDWLSFLARNGTLDLHVGIRSNDVIWGWSGINQFEWSALLEVTAGMTGLRPGALHFSTTSFHLYERHFAKAEKIRTQRLYDVSYLQPSPRFDATVVNRNFDSLENLFKHWFQIEYDIRTGSPLVQHYVDTFPEPMLRSWLRVLQWWWSEGVRKDEYLQPLEGTRIWAAAHTYSLQPPRPTPAPLSNPADHESTTLLADDRPVTTIVVPAYDKWLRTDAFEPSEFVQHAIKVHTEKHAAYGDSWKRRGEMLGILANIARKVDRLGKGETSDETSADTAMDLMVYLAKYREWLTDPAATDVPDGANDMLLRVDNPANDWSQTQAQDSEVLDQFLRDSFTALEAAVVADEPRFVLVDDMLVVAYVLARRLWEAEQDQYQGADVD
jgi:thymidylate synthase